MSTILQTPWVVSEISPALFSEEDEFKIKHTLLASVVQTSSKTSQTQSSLYHWHHHAPGPSLVIGTALTLDDLRHVSGFREIMLNHCSLHEETLMSLLIVSSDLSAQKDVDICESIFQNVISRLQRPIPTEERSSSNEATSPNLYSIEALSRTENAFKDGDADELIWKWAKPTSPYMKHGHWCFTIEEAIRQGVWNTGRGFILFGEKVGKQRKEILFQDGRIPVTL